jgi:ATP adenylyltransferase
MAEHRIWAPWRLRYVKGAGRGEECIFCTKPKQHDDSETLIATRGEHCYVILNVFPYTNGHLMVAPFEPEGFNVGINQGRVAGAGVEGHIHLHVVPRWAGDTNYMPVIADTRVMPQSLEDSYAALVAGFAR